MVAPLSSDRAAGTRHVPRVLALVVASGTISILHYLTDPSRVLWHEVYQHLYYVPVIVGAYWYGPWGGLLTAALTSLVYFPHIHATWGHNFPYAASQYAEIVVFHIIGVTVGILAAAERRVTGRYREAAASLERANRDLRDSYEQLRRADRLSALGEIATGLAHEIRNPIAGVKGALDIMRSRAREGTPEAEFGTIAAKELARLEGLVTEFLTYARPHEPSLRGTELRDVIDHVVALLGPEADRMGVRIETEEQADLPAVSIDPEQIQQVVFNVTLNAIQASRADTPVRIRAHADQQHALIDIIDEGPGIAPEHIGHIFDPFFTTKRHGTGLGLAISHRIVTAHRGTIEALPAPGRGTLVRIRLPLSRTAAGARPAMANAVV